MVKKIVGDTRMAKIPVKDKLRNYEISLLIGSIALIVEGLIMMWQGDIDFPSLPGPAVRTD